ncbi:MAG: hypothetical protein ACRD92_05610, partial [Nitrosopumilaceae archaeon]
MSSRESMTDRNDHFISPINRKSLIPLILTATLVILFGTIPAAAAQPVISLVNPITEIPLPGTTLNGQVRIIVDDSENSDFTDPESGIQVIDITVSSGVESIVIPLTETGEDTGIFKNVALFFTKETQKEFPLGETVTITQRENNSELGFENNDFIDTIYVDVFTVPDPVDVTTVRSFIFGFPLTETGPNTAYFTGHLLLTSGLTTENAIEAATGDLLNVAYNGEGTWGLMIPNPNDGVQVLRTEFNCETTPICDTLTVSYADVLDASLDIVPGSGGGGSGGGLLRIGFVLDVLAGGTSGGDFSPPTLTLSKLNLTNLPLVGDVLDFILNADPFVPIMSLDDPSIDYPVSINGNGYLLTQFANTIQTYTGKTGEPLSFKMTLFDATGVEHIALYTNLRGDAREVQDSDTYIIYNEDKPLEITDPHGYFSYVNFTESEYKGKYLAEFNMTFAKPMDTSDVIIRTWDEHLNSGDIKIFDAIKIEGEPIVN